MTLNWIRDTPPLHPLPTSSRLTLCNNHTVLPGHALQVASVSDSLRHCSKFCVCNWRKKNLSDATFYFIGLLVGSTCFVHYYAYHQELATIMLITTLVVSFFLCCRLEVSFSLQPGKYSNLTVTNLQPTANQERNDQYGNQHYRRELLMMGIVVPETCWAYKKYNKIIIGIQLVFYSSVVTMMHGPINIIFCVCVCVCVWLGPSIIFPTSGELQINHHLLRHFLKHIFIVTVSSFVKLLAPELFF